MIKMNKLILLLMIYLGFVNPVLAEDLYKSDSYIMFDGHSISPDKAKLAFITLGETQMKSDPIYTPTLTVIDVDDGRVVAELDVEKQFKYKARIINQSIRWDSTSSSIYFVLFWDLETVWKWEVITNKVSQYLSEPNRDQGFLSFSKDNKQLAYVSYPIVGECKKEDCWMNVSRESNILQLYFPTKGETIKIAENVDPVQPIWLDSDNLLYVKNEVIYKAQIAGDINISKLIELDEEMVKHINLIAPNKIGILTSTVTRVDDWREALRRLKQREHYNDLWSYDPVTNKLDHIITYTIHSLGVALDDEMAIFPLFGKEYTSVMYYKYKSKELVLIKLDPDNYNQPILVDSETLLLLRRYKAVTKAKLN